MSDVCGKLPVRSDQKFIRQRNPPKHGNQDATGDPVNVVTGAFQLDEQDLAFNVQRLVLSLSRHYDSLHHCSSKAPGPVGWGWTHSFHLYLEPGPSEGAYTWTDEKRAQVAPGK